VCIYFLFSQENGDIAEPELYCFEDFVSGETTVDMLLSSSTDSSDGSSHDRFTQSDTGLVMSTNSEYVLLYNTVKPVYTGHLELLDYVHSRQVPFKRRFY